MQELIDNINWPILSLNVIIKIISRPGGQLKKFRIIQKTLFEEILRRESGYLLPKSKEMPLRYCQINSYKAYFVNRTNLASEFQGIQDERLISSYKEYNCSLSDDDQKSPEAPKKAMIPFI